MGLDMYIFRSVRDDTTQAMLNKLEDKEEREEVSYWRKFWELQEFIGDELGVGY